MEHRLMTRKKLVKELILASARYSNETLIKEDLDNMIKNNRIRYDLGNYDKTIKNKVVDKDDLIWYENRTSGVVLYAINTNFVKTKKNGEYETYKKALNIWNTCKFSAGRRIL